MLEYHHLDANTPSKGKAADRNVVLSLARVVGGKLDEHWAAATIAAP